MKAAKSGVMMILPHYISRVVNGIYNAFLI